MAVIAEERRTYLLVSTLNVRQLVEHGAGRVAEMSEALAVDLRELKFSKGS